MTLLVVMGLISISLALSYATLRSQATVVQLQHNSDRMANARHAALSGVTQGLRNMCQSNWAGVDTTLSGWLSPTESYTVTFTTGDPSLTSADPNYGDLPYRVTLLATGFAQDPANSAAIATYRIRAVTRLVPRKLADEPAGWDNLADYTVYQWKAATGGTYRFQVEVPARGRFGARAAKARSLSGLSRRQQCLYPSTARHERHAASGVARLSPVCRADRFA